MLHWDWDWNSVLSKYNHCFNHRKWDRKNVSVNIRWLKWNVASGKVLFCKRVDAEHNHRTTEIKFIITDIYASRIKRSSTRPAIPAIPTPLYDYPLTFADVFDNVLVRNTYNSDDYIVMEMSVEPRSDFILCTDAAVNKTFQSATSLDFYLFDLKVSKNRFHITTAKWDLELFCQLVME